MNGSHQLVEIPAGTIHSNNNTKRSKCPDLSDDQILRVTNANATVGMTTKYPAHLMTGQALKIKTRLAPLCRR